MVRRVLLILALAAVALLALSGVALAATPQQIYDDYVDNGKLDGTYTDAELRAYLRSAYVHQYGDLTKTTELDTLVKRILAARDRFPFTGVEIALFAVGVAVLAGAGIGLRRLARRKT
jgi:hypothetical protein